MSTIYTDSSTITLDIALYLDTDSKQSSLLELHA